MSDTGRDLVLPINSFDTMYDGVDLAQRAEELGYGHVTMGETTGWNMVSLLTLLAEHTDDIGITNDVFCPPSRSPSMLGQTAVTLDELSDGRYRLGLGASSPALVERWHGGGFEPALRRVRETIDIVRQVYSGERLDYDGECYEVSTLSLDRPAPESPPPIDVASLGPKGTELAGRFADGWVPQLFTPDGIRERLEDLRRGAEMADRDPDEVRTALTVRSCAMEDGEEARRIARTQVAFMIARYGPYYRQSIASQGWADTTDEIAERWEEGDQAGAIQALGDDLLEEVVAAGTPDEVRERVAAFDDVDGLDAVQVGFFAEMDEDAQRTTLETLAPE